MKNKIVSKALAGVLSAATLTGSGNVGGVEVKAYSPQVISYNNAGLSSSKKILLAVGAASTATLGTLLIAGGAFAYNEYHQRNMRAWDKLKNLTGTDFENKLSEAIKLIDEIAGCESQDNYDINKARWASEVTNFKGIFNDFFTKISSIRNRISYQGLSGNRLEVFVSLDKLVKKYNSYPNFLTFIFDSVNSGLGFDDKDNAIEDAKDLQTKLENFKTDLENLKSLLYNL